MIVFESTVGPKGQVVIPKPIRDSLRLLPGAKVRVTLEGGRILVEPPRNDIIEVCRRILSRGKSVRKIDLDQQYEESIGRRKP